MSRTGPGSQPPPPSDSGAKAVRGDGSGNEPESATGSLTLAVRSDRIVLAGLLAWLVALLVILLVPSLHSGQRDWWPWACLCGIALGALGWIYLRRGRGNAAEANRPVPVPPGAADAMEQARERRGDSRR